MAELDLDAIEARANAATPAPWKVNRLNGMGVDKVLASINGVGTAGFDDGWPNGDREVFRSEWEPNAGIDADFIAAARADVPALVAEVRRLRAIEYAVRLFIAEWRAFAKSGLGIPSLTTAQLSVVELLENDLNAAEKSVADA